MKVNNRKVNNNMISSVKPEGDESCVESSVADWVVMSTKSREPGCTLHSIHLAAFKGNHLASRRVQNMIFSS